MIPIILWWEKEWYLCHDQVNQIHNKWIICMNEMKQSVGVLRYIITTHYRLNAKRHTYPSTINVIVFHWKLSYLNISHMYLRNQLLENQHTALTMFTRPKWWFLFQFWKYFKSIYSHQVKFLVLHFYFKIFKF